MLYLSSQLKNKIKLYTNISAEALALRCKEATKDFRTNSINSLTVGKKGGIFIQGDSSNQIKFGKLLRVLFPSMLDHNIEGIVSKHKMNYEIDTSMVLLDTNISKVYNISKVGGSCMANKDEDYFEIYKDIESSIAYILDDDGDLLARALIHTVINIDTNQEILGMDRIFYNIENSKLTLQKYCSDNGMIDITGKENCDKYISVNAISKSYDSVPYADTLEYVVEKEGLYYLANNNHYSIIDELREVNGSSSSRVICSKSSDDVYCEDTGNYVCVDDVIWVDSEECYYENEEDLVFINDYYYNTNSDLVCYVEDTSEWALKDDGEVTLCEYYDQWFSNDLVVYCRREDSDYHIDVCEYISSENIHTLAENAIYSKENDMFYHMDNDCITKHNGEYIHKDDLKIILKEEKEND